jgi:uncharacterized protein YukE
MTAGGFEVDPARLRSVSPQFDAVSDRLGYAGAALTTALSAEGDCWGGDESGQTFAQNYLPNVDATTKALRTMVGALHAIRTSLDASADTWDGVDQGAAHGFGCDCCGGGPR